MNHVVSTLAIGLFGALLAAGGVVLWRHYRPVEDCEADGGDVVEYLSMMIALLYALLLGLALVSVWELRGDAGSNTSTEAGALHQMTMLADGMPPAQQKRIEIMAERYAVHVVQQEWPLLEAQQPLGEQGWVLLQQLRAVSEAPPDATPAQEVTALEMLGQLSVLDEARRGRESAAGDSLSPLLWAGLAVGAVLSFCIVFFYGVGRTWSHLVMLMGMVGLTVFLAVLIHHLATPFGEVMGVAPDPFTEYFPRAATAGA
ncbi:hypothetical protein AB0A69_23950 [Streptomyces sp. NPDC045431]|uniref:bestrophin-like domain n=1 Tax=Streptomyces sp. NPDC045431 TaxID=3155613 RepID=UPI0033F6E583